MDHTTFNKLQITLKKQYNSHNLLLILHFFDVWPTWLCGLPSVTALEYQASGVVGEELHGGQDVPNPILAPANIETYVDKMDADINTA